MIYINPTYFRYSRLSAAIKFLAIAPLFLVAEQAMAVKTVDGAVGTGKFDVKSTTLIDNYILRNNATLNVEPGGRTRDIQSSFSTLNMTGGRVTGIDKTRAAVALNNSKATISDSVITSSAAGGLSLVRNPAVDSGSEARVSNSHITGATYGANVTAFSLLQLSNGSTVTGLGREGLLLQGGRAEVVNSHVKGATNGVLMTREHRTVLNSPTLVLEGSHVNGLNGAAILVDQNITAQIDVNNGSTLTGSNGNLLEMTNGANANMRVNNSALTGNIQLGTDSLLNLGLDGASLTGDVVNTGGTANVALSNHSVLTGNLQVGADSVLNLNLDRAAMTGDVVNAGGTANVALNNHSVLTGRLENVDSLAVNSDATWVMTAGQQLNDLSLGGGNVKFGEPGQFYQLDVKNLSGNGTFVMSADFAHLKGDFLNVTGTSSGAHQLLIASSGADPLCEDRLHVVHTEDGGATFSLLGERVDVGTYSYRLIDENDGKDWLLDPKSKIISPGTRSVLALFNTAPTVWYGEMTSLRTRMGEVRFNPEQTGGWVRAYGNRFDVSSGGGYKQSQQGFTLGADMPIADSQWVVGVMAGHSNSQLDLTHGTSGTVKSYYLGAYATWLDEDGYYFDAVAKANRFQNESNVAVSDGSKVKGSYNNTGIGVSAEFGRKIKLKDDYFVEPYAQLSTVSIQGASYQLDNGLKASGESTRSILGKAGVTAGRDFQLEDGSVIQPYLRAAMVHEFANNSKVTVNNSNVFKNDLSGSRAEFGAGVAVKVSKNLQLHADFEHSQGKNIDQPWGANVGVRYSF